MKSSDSILARPTLWVMYDQSSLQPYEHLKCCWLCCKVVHSHAKKTQLDAIVSAGQLSTQKEASTQCY